MQKNLTIALLSITLSCFTHTPLFASHGSKDSHSGSTDESGEEEKKKVLKPKAKTKKTSPAAVPRSTAGSLSAPTKTTGKNSARLVELRDVKIVIPEELKKNASAPAKAGLKKAASKQSKNSQEETDEDDTKGFTTPVTTKTKSRTDRKAKTAASYESANEQSDEESATPSSEQRLIIMRNRSLIESSGSIPEDLHEKLTPSILSIPHAAFAPSILPCLLKLISEEREGICGACYEFDDKALAQAWVNASKNNKIEGELVVNRSSLTDKKSMKEAVALLLAQKIQVFQNKQRHNGKNEKIGATWINLDTTNKKYGTGGSDGKLKFYENMHHKFFIFRNNETHGILIVTGSYNWTTAANDKNWENIVILNDESTIQRFLEEWGVLESYREPVTVKLLQ